MKTTIWNIRFGIVAVANIICYMWCVFWCINKCKIPSIWIAYKETKTKTVFSRDIWLHEGDFIHYRLKSGTASQSRHTVYYQWEPGATLPPSQERSCCFSLKILSIDF